MIFLSKMLIASNNKKKLLEMSAILSSLGFECVTLKDLNIECDPEETGKTFSENAYIKAKCGMEKSGLPCIADDSGLCCNALDGAPGIFSARYCDGTDEDRVAFLLKNMEDKEDRKAHFVSAISCVFPNGDEVKSEGECHGEILRETHGTGGFGYDPVFYVSQHNGTFSEISQEIKNQISHRAVALEKFKEKMELYIKEKGL